MTLQLLCTVSAHSRGLHPRSTQSHRAVRQAEVQRETNDVRGAGVDPVCLRCFLGARASRKRRRAERMGWSVTSCPIHGAIWNYWESLAATPTYGHRGGLSIPVTRRPRDRGWEPTRCAAPLSRCYNIRCRDSARCWTHCQEERLQRSAATVDSAAALAR